MKRYALVMAAGAGTRMGLAGGKVLAPLCGKTVLERSVGAFLGLVDGIVIVAREADMAAIAALRLPATVVRGGDTRQRSVLRGLLALPEDADIVLVHDAARPFVTGELIARCIRSAEAHGSGVAAIPVTDTIKRTEDGAILHTPERAGLFAAQTPQAFSVPRLRRAIEALEAKGQTATDDAAALEAAGERPRIVPGDRENIKLTVPSDLRQAEWMLSGKGGDRMRIGSGYDAHRLAEGRRLVLCGVDIPNEKGLLGHSDADVACHALMDALLGAAALSDIGTHFPATDEAFRGISSLLLLKKVAGLLSERGFAVGNVDLTIVAERPKLAPHVPRMRANIAEALGLSVDRVSVKATTTEGLGFEGEERGMSAHAVAALCS